ncbi:coatomer subunit epsilon [Lycorma delicatula]|uniref:coatomer subunit epsilon n=1 Tax=Lycorma delicatula TaxID=130591 RepID=UPI003F50D956
MTTSRQSGSVELFDIKNSFYIGSYQQCINEAQKLKPSSPDQQLERDLFLYRAYIAQKKYRIVLDEINSSSPAELQPLRVLADFMANPSNRDRILATLDEQIEKSASSCASQVAAIINSYEKNYEAALRALHQDDSLESMATNLVIYLQMDRIDLARKELKSMQEKDEDATLTQLSQAWVNIAVGGDRLQDAFYIFQEMIDKYGASVILLNGQATCNIGMGRFDDAEPLLQEAMDRDSNHPDTLINQIVLCEQLGKHQEANRMLSQLKESSNQSDQHQYVKDYINKEQEFARLAKQYASATA